MSQDSASSGGSQKLGPSFHDVDQPTPPGVHSNTNSPMYYNSPQMDSKCLTPDNITAPKLKISMKGVEQAKKRLRAFSIQKKQPLTQTILPKITSTTGSTVLIGKLCSAKVSSKAAVGDQDEQKRPPKPPKPGSANVRADSYLEMKKKTQAEIEDMKRKMELVELGIPLGLICPPTRTENSLLPTKAMPTKAMPPIKTFLDAEKLDEIIREAKKAKAEGKEFKFDYSKILPDYDNPFQRKKDDHDDKNTTKRDSKLYDLKSERDAKDYRHEKKDRRDLRKYTEHRSKSQYYKTEEKYDRNRERDKYRDEPEHYDSDTVLHLKDFVVCDSWSPSDKPSSPVVDENVKVDAEKPKTNKEKLETEKPNPDVEKPKKDVKPVETPKENVEKDREPVKKSKMKSDRVKKFEKLKPVMDSFTFEIDGDDDLALDMFDEDGELESFSKKTRPKSRDHDDDSVSKDISMNNEDFLESVIKELKEEAMSDDDSTQDKALVEYDLSPDKNGRTPDSSRSSTVTPELKSDAISGFTSTESGCKSTESGYKSTESGYKSTESGRKSVESMFSTESFRLTDVECANDKQTMDSLETWSFVLKICQPLLFRHDRNKCYVETRTLPKLWYAENPKVCDCVQDRKIVYNELELFKMSLVDRVYGCDQISDFPSATRREWYSRESNCLQPTVTSATVQLSSEWETEDSQSVVAPVTPTHDDDVSLDIEYQRFMDAVWPEISDPKESRSTTPTNQESQKRPADDGDEKKRAKKMKLSSDGWSKESEVEDNAEDSNKKTKVKMKTKKRKLSTSTLSESTDPDAELSRKSKKKMSKKKNNKKNKAKLEKRRKLEKKYIKKLKEKQKKKAKKIKERSVKIEDESDDENMTEKSKKSKKKKQQKRKKESKKKKADTSTSSESSSSSDSESPASEKENKRKKKIKKKQEAERNKRKKKEKKKKRKQSTSESTQDDDGMFDVNILNNIKTEKLTDDEKAHKKIADMQDFSPRRQQKKPRHEIINIKELQNDLEFSNMHIKKEKVDVADKVADVEEVAEQESVEEELDKETHVDCAEKKEVEIVEVPKESPRPVDQPVPKEAPNAVEQPAVDVQVPKVSPKPAVDIQLPKVSSKPTVDIQVPKVSPKPTVDIQLPKVSPKPTVVIQLPKVSPKPTVDIPLPKASPKPTVDIQLPKVSPKPVEEPVVDELSQNSSQDSTISNKEPAYEKDDSHLRPSSQNSNYSFNDVMSSQPASNYEMYEHLAMEYQSGVATQQSSETVSSDTCRIETVVSRHSRGEIKCDWRPPAASVVERTTRVSRPSRWGLKPGDANIVLTGHMETTPVYKIRSVLEPETYQIESITGLGNDSTGYDEAYADMYAASDRLQYGDCFQQQEPVGSLRDIAGTPRDTAGTLRDTAGTLRDTAGTLRDTAGTLRDTAGTLRDTAGPAPDCKEIRTSLDVRIDLALRETALGGRSKEEGDQITTENEKSITAKLAREKKSVSFADGYKPGQDSDTEEPPKKRHRARRYGSPWPCPASHPDHVPLWDALPPPPPPPDPPSSSSSSSSFPQPPLLTNTTLLNYDPSLVGMMQSEPLPGMVALQHIPL